MGLNRVCDWDAVRWGNIQQSSSIVVGGILQRDSQWQINSKRLLINCWVPFRSIRIFYTDLRWFQVRYQEEHITALFVLQTTSKSLEYRQNLPKMNYGNIQFDSNALFKLEKL